MAAADALALRHLRFGWWSLLAWLAVGIGLETLHGFKVSWYLAVGNETRRLLFTLGHAHGTLLALVHVAFAVTVARSAATARASRVASPCLTAAALLLPAGFLLGGIVVYEGSDPGPGIFLVPVGAGALVAGVLAAALAVTRRAPPGPASDQAPAREALTPGSESNSSSTRQQVF